MRSLFSSLLPSCSSRLRGSLKKDIGEKCDSLRLCSFATLRETLCVLCVWSGSLKKDVGELRVCDSEALLQAVRFLGG